MRTPKPLLAALLGTTLFLAGCKDAASPEAPATATKATETVSVAAVAAEAKGFTVGSEMSVRRVYVFFDAQCPHCAALWTAAKPLRSQARFIWVPVGLLNDASRSQGAALLAASDPVAAMNQHEASLQAKQGGLTATGELKEQREHVAKNTQLFNRFGLSSVPTVVANHAQTGALVVKEGSMSTATLAGVLGLQLPGGN
jgi:thiol:disulfide interchange protein DsbG